MSKDETREERLAAKLRENLRRRKSQAKAMSDSNANEPQARKGDRPPAADAACCVPSEDARTEVLAKDKPDSLSKESKDS
ncbi:hypothetical protein [Aurantiacibacter sp. D1-12]|uniref:hypothetical protein n=1 Tax=Aurantiacibacter sp. D1-12 TaxID=2993658 RepID=UPI00237C89A1|nr:hypothetical protein [Aurantiacibacter sp. D1-12]MDE1468051.1 hypothetical protein [Aurantiacibacter sp. D1-12]